MRKREKKKRYQHGKERTFITIYGKGKKPTYVYKKKPKSMKP